jgi:nicotinamidase/pyrazinamidase
MIERFRPDDTLLVVDVQPDFCPGGALPVPGGQRVISPLNECLEAAAEREILVCASRDWHPPAHPSFQSEGGDWPPHCVQDTKGAAYHPELRLPASTVKIAKGTRLDRDQYSAFDETGLAPYLRSRGITRLWIGGLAQDVCVRATVLDALREGFVVHLLTSATAPIDPEEGRKALSEMKGAGAVIETR